MRTCKGIVIIFLLTGKVSAFEPVSAVDDGFAVPYEEGMVAASVLYPGAESYLNGGFIIAAWSVPYGLEDMAVTTCHTGFNFGKTGLSVSYSGSGFDLYGEEQEKLGISLSPFKWISTGFRITRNAIRIKNFGRAAAWSTDTGMIFHLSESLYIAAALEDLVSAELGSSCEPLDGKTRLAATWRTGGNVTLLASLTKVRRFDPSLSAGFTAEIVNILTIGVMGAHDPDRFEFLCSVKPKKIVFSYRGSYHRELGMSHGFSINWCTGDYKQ